MKRTLTLGIIMVLLLASVGAVSANLVTNGGFETITPPWTGTYVTLSPVDTDITPWSIDSGSIDLINSYWQPASGSYSIDLAGNAKGTIGQDLATTPGGKYDLSFMMAGNPDSTKGIKAVEVFWGGASQGTFTFDTTGNSAGSMGWLPKGKTGLVATGATTKLQFVDVTGGSAISTPYGAALDSISVEDQTTPIPEFPTMALPAALIVGLIGAVLFIRKSRNN
jgi:choice-of-anchor C domain-containing protein